MEGQAQDLRAEVGQEPILPVRTDTDITHDPGTVGYGSPLHRGYYTRGLNHNVPLINGEGESTKGPQKLGLALHVQGKARLPASFAADPNFGKSRPAAFGYWRDVRSATFRDRAEIDVDYGNGGVMHLTLTAPGEFTLSHGSSPDVPPRRRESFYLELSAPAAEATFTTTWSPSS